MASIYQQRLKEIKKLFESSPETCALLVSANPLLVRSRDTHYEYRPNSDLYYLTGSKARSLTLLVSENHKRPILFAPKPDPKREVWDGKGPNLKLVASSINAELKLCDNIQREVLSALRGTETLYYQNIAGTVSQQVASQIERIAAHERIGLPKTLGLVDLILEQMRLFKSKDEIKAIVTAASITNEGLYTILPLIKPGISEAEIAYTLEYAFRLEGASAAFGTIVAAGPSAATLHHTDYKRKLKKGEMVLIDCGAERDMYCADITRVLPVSKQYSPLQRELYSIVLKAQRAAIKAVRHNVQVKQVHQAAVEVITEGLVALKVLKGPISKLIKKQAYKPYFMHGIGHGLGLDVHDVGEIRSTSDTVLEEGMVLTIEPGIYFQKPHGKIPACGIRIEDDVLVTRHGAEVLSAGFPKEIDEVEQLFI